MFGHTNFVQSLHLPLPAMSNPTSARTSATFSESVMASEAQIISNTSLDQPTPKRLVEYDCSKVSNANNDAPLAKLLSLQVRQESTHFGQNHGLGGCGEFSVDTYHDYIQGHWMHPWKLTWNLKTAISKEGNHLSSGTLFSLLHAIVLGRLLASLATIWDDLPTQDIIQCTIGNMKNQPVTGQFQHVSFVTSPSFVVRQRQPTATPEDVTPFATSTSARSFSARSSCMRLKLSWQKPRLGSASACWFMDVFMDSVWLFTGTKWIYINGSSWRTRGETSLIHLESHVDVFE